MVGILSCCHVGLCCLLRAMVSVDHGFVVSGIRHRGCGGVLVGYGCLSNAAQGEQVEASELQLLVNYIGRKDHE